MDLIIEPITFVFLSVAPNELSFPLHLFCFEVALVVSTIQEGVLALTLFGSIDEVTFIECAIEVLFTTLTMQFTINLDTILTCCLPGYRLSHRDHNV